MNIYTNRFVNNKYTKWYYSIIKHIQSQDRKKLSKDDPDYVYYEDHHVLPRSIYPEYEDLRKHPWNLARCTAKEHFILHHLLIKMPKDHDDIIKMKCARLFLTEFIGKTSIIYEKMKEQIHKENNLFYNKNHTDEQKKKWSNDRSGFINAKDKDGNYFKVTKDDPRWISGELVGIRKGFKDNETTRNNKSKGLEKLLWWNNGTEQLRAEKCPGEGWVNKRLNFSPSNKGLPCWNNGVNNIYSEECPGEGFIRGSFSEPGFLWTKENNPNMNKKKEDTTSFGLLSWTDGKSNKRAEECPGEGWRRGMTTKRNKK